MNRENHNTPQHTPTPWRASHVVDNQRTGIGRWMLLDAEGHQVLYPCTGSNVRQHETIERIVRAVNRDHAFEPMREALQALADAYDADDLRAMHEATKAARAALALAEEV